MQGPARPSGAILLALLAKLSVKALPAKMSTAKRFSSLAWGVSYGGCRLRVGHGEGGDTVQQLRSSKVETNDLVLALEAVQLVYFCFTLCRDLPLAVWAALGGERGMKYSVEAKSRLPNCWKTD
jgi:hypothetical protein